MRGIYLKNTKRNMVMLPIKVGSNFFVLDKTIEDTVRLPLSVSRGSEKQRFRKAQKFSNKLRKMLDKTSKGNSCTVEQFKEALDKLLGKYKINYIIEKETNKNTKGSVSYFIGGREYQQTNENGNYIFIDRSVSKVSINLPMDESKKFITNKYTARHEARHVFDVIFNPKNLVNRTFDIEIASPEEKKAASDIFESFVNMPQNPTDIKNLKESIKENLKILNDDMAIDILQMSRNRLKTEINAYKDKTNYLLRSAFRLNNLSHIFDNIANVYKYKKSVNNAKQKQKLQIDNELLRERLQIARENTKKNSEPSKHMQQHTFRTA